MTFKEAVDRYKINFALVGSPFYGNSQIDIFPLGGYIFMSLDLYDYLQSERENNNNPYDFLKDLPVKVNIEEDATKEDSIIKNYANGFLGNGSNKDKAIVL